MGRALVQTTFFTHKKGGAPSNPPKPFLMPADFPQITEIPTT
jgi:hypothetical protein